MHGYCIQEKNLFKFIHASTVLEIGHKKLHPIITNVIVSKTIIQCQEVITTIIIIIIYYYSGTSTSTTDNFIESLHNILSV